MRSLRYYHEVECESMRIEREVFLRITLYLLLTVLFYKISETLSRINIVFAVALLIAAIVCLTLALLTIFSIFRSVLKCLVLKRITR